MKIQEIEKWLETPTDYSAGLDLYVKYGTDETLKKILSFGETQFNRDKLYDGLEAIAKESQVPQPAKPKERPQATDLPPELAERYEQSMEWYKRLATLKANLKYLKDPEERRKTCLYIATNYAAMVKPGFQAVDHYRETGELPPKTEEQNHLERLESLSESQLWAVQMIKNIPPRLTKARKKGDDEKVAELEELYGSIKMKLGYE